MAKFAVDESGFWLALEYRICSEFRGMKERHLRAWWCDGLVPSVYHFEEEQPLITGVAWMVNGRDQQQWEFTLRLSPSVRSRDEIPWTELLPPEDATRWLTFGRDKRSILIDPSAAVPDGASGV